MITAVPSLYKIQVCNEEMDPRRFGTNLLFQIFTVNVPRHTLTSCHQRMKFDCCRLIKSYEPLHMIDIFLT